MFVFLSKKIAIPQKVPGTLQVVDWNASNGWIACGGERGTLKVLKIDSPSESDAQAAQGPGGGPVAMNQTLGGHEHTIMVATWNEQFRKLTTSDQSGLIVVWMLHRGSWFEEMVNNRNQSMVRYHPSPHL